MEPSKADRKIKREVNPRPFLPGEKELIARTHKKMMAARAERKVISIERAHTAEKNVSEPVSVK